MVVNAYDGRDLNRAKPSLSAVWSRLKVVFTAALATALLSLLAPAARANGDLASSAIPLKGGGAYVCIDGQ